MFGCLVALIASLPFIDFEVVRVAGRSLVLPHVVALSLAIPLLGSDLRRAVSGVRRDQALPWLLAWLAVAVLSAAVRFADYQDPQVLAKNLTQVASAVLMVAQYALMVAALATLSLRQLERLLAVAGGVLSAAAVYSIAQVAAVSLGFRVPDLFRTSNLYYRIDTLVPTGAGGWSGTPRAFGFAPEPSFWGGYLVVTGGFLVGRWEREHRAATLAQLVLVALAMVLTFARGTWLVALLLGVAWLAWRRRPFLNAIPFGLLAAAVALSLVTAVAAPEPSPGTGPLDGSAVHRLETQRAGLRMFADWPVLGGGLGSLEFFAEQYARRVPGVPHYKVTVVLNWYLAVLSSTGLLGALAFAGFLGSVAAGVLRGSRARPPGSPLPLAAAASVLAVEGFWLNTPALNMTFLWFAFAVASRVAWGPDGAPDAGASEGRAAGPAPPSVGQAPDEGAGQRTTA